MSGVRSSIPGSNDEWWAIEPYTIRLLPISTYKYPVACFCVIWGQKATLPATASWIHEPTIGKSAYQKSYSKYIPSEVYLHFIKLIFTGYTYIIWIYHWNIYILQSTMLFLPSWPPCSAPRSTPPELPAAPDASGLVGCCCLKGNSMTRADQGFSNFIWNHWCFVEFGWVVFLPKFPKWKSCDFNHFSWWFFFLTGLVPDES